MVVFTDWVDFPEGTVLPFWLGNGADTAARHTLSPRRRAALTPCISHIRSNPAIGTRTGYTSGQTRSETTRASNSGRGTPAYTRSPDVTGQPVSGGPICRRLPAHGNARKSSAVPYLPQRKLCDNKFCWVFPGIPHKSYPYVLFGALSAPSFEYGTEELTLVEIEVDDGRIFIVEGPDGGDVRVIRRGLAVNFNPGVPESFTNRLAFSLYDEVLAWNEAYYASSDGKEFLWRYSGPAWTEADEIDVKLIELATASFNEASFAKSEGDIFDVTVTLDEAFVQTTVTLPITVTANAGRWRRTIRASPRT